MIDAYGQWQEQFPTVRRLWEGAILSTPAQAVTVACEPEFAYLEHWDGPNYVLNNGSGDQGAITFQGQDVVGVFFAHESERSPYGHPDGYDWRAYFRAAPAPLVALAEEHALQSMLDDYLGPARPFSTAAFWSADETMTAGEPWPLVYQHGGERVRIQILESEAALRALQEPHDLTPLPVDLIRTLFQRKLAALTQPLVLTPAERVGLLGSDSPGEAESRDLLAKIGIRLP